MKFDFKVTAWERVTVPDYLEEKVLQAIKSGRINSAEDVFTFLIEEEGDANAFCDMITDYSEQMTVEENGGAATIEVQEGMETIWDNSISVKMPYVVQINDSEGEALGLVCSDDVRDDSLEDIVSKSWEKYIDDDNEYDIYSFIEWHNADPDNTGCQLQWFYISAVI